MEGRSAMFVPESYQGSVSPGTLDAGTRLRHPSSGASLSSLGPNGSSLPASPALHSAMNSNFPTMIPANQEHQFINNNTLCSTTSLPFPPTNAIINFDAASTGPSPVYLAQSLISTSGSTPAIVPGNVTSSNLANGMLGSPSSSSSAVKFDEGYDYDFLDPLESRFECPICHLCLKEPCQTECGHRFCRSCIQNWISRGQPTCPMDNVKIQQSHIYPDTFAKREILGLKVKCPNHVYGCRLELTIRSVEEHKLECTYTPEPCPNFCGKLISLPQLTDHLLSHCPKRLTNCRHCRQAGSHDEMTSSTHATGSCASEEIRCDFSAVGCPAVAARRDMASHAKENVVDHMLLLCRGVARLKEEMQGVASSARPESLAEVQHLIEEVARLQLSLQLQSREPHGAAALFSDVTCGGEATEVDPLGHQLKDFTNGGVIPGKVTGSTLPRSRPNGLPDPTLNDSQILSTSSSNPELLHSSNNTFNGLINDNYHRARLDKFRDDVSSLGDRLATQEQRGAAAERRLRDAEVKLREKEQQITELQSLRLENSRLKTRLDDMEARFCNGVLLWKIESFWQLVDDAAKGGVPARYSPPFYSSPQGYKLCLRINPHGVEGYVGKCVSIFVHMMPGEYDDFLPWPFQGHVMITILDQRPRTSSLTSSAASTPSHQKPPISRDFTQLLIPTPTVAAYQRPTHLRGLRGFGFKDFISLDELRNPEPDVEFVANDALLIRVDVDGAAPPIGTQLPAARHTLLPPGYQAAEGVQQTPQHQFNCTNHG